MAESSRRRNYSRPIHEAGQAHRAAVKEAAAAGPADPNSLGIKDDASLDDTLAAINKKYYADYEQNTIPLEDKLIDRYKNYDTTNQAQKDAIKARRILGQVEDRNQSRYGISTTAERGNYKARTRMLGGSSTTAGAVNDARVEDQDYKASLLTNILNQGSNLRNNSQQGLGTAAGLEASRKRANDSAEAQKDAAQKSMLGTGLGIAAAFLI